MSFWSREGRQPGTDPKATIMMRVRHRLYPYRRYLKWMRYLARWQMRSPFPYELKWRFARWVSLLTSGPGELVHWRLPNTPIRFALDLTEVSQADLFYNSGTHPEILQLMQRYVRPDRIFVDAGANVGQETLWAGYYHRKHGATHAMVFAFEPNPEMLLRLHYNIRLNELETVICLSDCAISDSDGKATFYLSPRDNSSSSSLAANRFVGGETVEVCVVSLDSFFSQQRQQIPVGLLKIDIEGAELHAVRGASKLLARDQPMLILEAYPEMMEGYGHSYPQLHGFLSSLGYSVYVIESADRLVIDTEGRLPTDRRFYNLICFPSRYGDAPNRGPA